MPPAMEFEHLRPESHARKGPCPDRMGCLIRLGAPQDRNLEASDGRETGPRRQRHKLWRIRKSARTERLRSRDPDVLRALERIGAVSVSPRLSALPAFAPPADRPHQLPISHILPRRRPPVVFVSGERRGDRQNISADRPERQPSIVSMHRPIRRACARGPRSKRPRGRG